MSTKTGALTSSSLTTCTSGRTKRLKRKRDKETLKQFKQDIFDETTPTETTIKKYFKLTKDYTEYNVAYKNATCEKVNKIVRAKLLKKTNEYAVGEVLVCRTYFKMKKQVFNVNYEYKITTLECEAITLNNTLLVPVDTVRKNFIHNNCRTCHSFQGTSLDERITILRLEVRPRQSQVAVHRSDKGNGVEERYVLRL